MASRLTSIARSAVSLLCVSSLRMIVFGVSFVSLSGLTPQNASGQQTVTFNKDVRPILSDKCFFCHGPDSSKREADLRLDNRESAVNSGAIVPGKPDESAVIQRILSDDPEIQMPPAHAKLGRLTDSEVNVLKEWIRNGAEYENHWSFIPSGN